MAKFKLAKTAIITTLLVIIISSFVYWLWQRQPNGLEIQGEQFDSPAQVQTSNDLGDDTQKLDLDNYKVVSTKELQAKGKTKPDSYIITASNATQSVSRSDKNGDYTLNISFEEGLNLTNIHFLDQDLKKFESYSFTHFLSLENTSGKTVYSGLVKGIFENIITITTLTDEKSVKKESSTKVTIPKLPGVQEKASDQDIRVGDYMIALGKNGTTDQLLAQTIDIFRDSKPQNLRNFTLVEILSSISKNSFSAKQEGQDKTVKITTDKNTKFIKDNKSSDEKVISKNSKAIIIFYENEKSADVADLIYLLP